MDFDLSFTVLPKFSTYVPLIKHTPPPPLSLPEVTKLANTSPTKIHYRYLIYLIIAALDTNNLIRMFASCTKAALPGHHKEFRPDNRQATTTYFFHVLPQQEEDTCLSPATPSRIPTITVFPYVAPSTSAIVAVRRASGRWRWRTRSVAQLVRMALTGGATGFRRDSRSNSN